MLPFRPNMENPDDQTGNPPGRGNPGPGTGQDIIRLLIEAGQERQERMTHLQEMVNRQTTALDSMTTHLTDMTKQLRELRTHEEPTPDEKEQAEIARRRRIPPPIFKGNAGERPEAHILRAKDWMEAIGITKEEDKVTNFKLTLDHFAWEWYNDTGTDIDKWETLIHEFSRYFSTQGKSMRNLHSRWKKFEFNPDTDDIEEFVRNVQECAHQLNYDDAAIMNMIKSCMPMSIYGSLYEKTTLASVITMVKDLYAKGPDGVRSEAATAAAPTPFSQIKGAPLEATLNKLTDALYKLDAKPFKPYIAPRG